MAAHTTEKESARETVLSLLSGDSDPWTWGDSNQCSLTFDKNGTGTMLCGEGMRTLIAVEFEWNLNNTLNAGNNDHGSYKFEIQLTLTTRLHPLYQKRNPWLAEGDGVPTTGPVPWAPLTSDAFQPQKYILSLEKGRFIEPFHTFQKKPFPLFQSEPYRFAPSRYAYRITFDKSPYPTLEEWQPEVTKQPDAVKACLDYHRFWDRREFVRQLIPKSEETWAETLSVGWWLSSTAGAAHMRRD